MPKKTNYRMRAHINPLNEFKHPIPPSPEWVDWSVHFPAFFGILDNNEDKLVANVAEFPACYDKKPEHSEELKKVKVDILDIGCGYGNLLLELSKEFPNDLIFGMEIRDKVTEFVVNKINSLRINSGYTKFTNVSAIRTNVMKCIFNYFEKETLSKMFFCFADPHFKKVNFRRRIINSSLLTEYAYLLKEGGKIYTVTDVKSLYDWNVSFLGSHPLFEEVTGEEKDNDPCIKMMCEMTDEAKKVIKRGDPCWAAVFRKKAGKPSEQTMLKYFL
eukprot:CAMPEP_0168332192 /NCGR_PEP_ID=MMETSP0213-20121227/8812_1 /TAXON_ID=151035 /ORGANISM="Euplotes harpa, Strain FSP1.4" /LENGTH=272 /DNA_ID=CAMNT_0008336171 /DNA_START=301 /DNA_END=1120 /DNA_ORIENTATION=+